MAAPSKAWVDLTDAEIDGDSPIDEGGPLTVLRNQLIHLKEVAYGTGSYVGDVPHDHDGAEDQEILAPVGHNLVIQPCPGGSPQYWTRSNFDEAAGGSYVQRCRSPGTATAGDHMYQDLAGGNADCWGAGTPMVLSCFMKVSASASAGVVSLGLSDAGTTHVTNFKGAIDFNDLTTAWKRFYVILDGTVGGRLPHNATDFTATNALRLLLRIDTTFTTNVEVWVTGFMANVGTTLSRFFWCPIDTDDENFDAVPTQGVGILEDLTAMTNADEITAT